MGEAYYFQRYYTKENAHSSNALLLLKRTYYHSPKIFYKVLENWLEIDNSNYLPIFVTQDKGKHSVPDFSIKQSGFKIIVEAKEKSNHFTEDQLERHLNSLKNDVGENKIFIVLAPKFSEADKNAFEKLKLENVKLIKITYMDLYENIKVACDDIKDEDLIEILEEYRNYCNEEGLIDETNSTIMVRLAGQTYDFNVKAENNLYYDKFENRYEGFRYLALYKNKAIRHIGKIIKIVKAYYDSTSNLVCEGLYPHKCAVSQDDVQRVERALKNQKELYDNINVPHCYYLIDKFIEVENFIKSTKRALYGKKKFYLQQFGLKADCEAFEIAEKMKNKTWEEVENKE